MKGVPFFVKIFLYFTFIMFVKNLTHSKNTLYDEVIIIRKTPFL